MSRMARLCTIACRAYHRILARLRPPKPWLRRRLLSVFISNTNSEVTASGVEARAGFNNRDRSVCALVCTSDSSDVVASVPLLHDPLLAQELAGDLVRLHGKNHAIISLSWNDARGVDVW